MKTLAQILRDQIKALGFKEVKLCAAEYGIGPENLRRCTQGAVPKNATLVEWSAKLGIDLGVLVLTADWERAPEAVKPLLAPLVKQVQIEHGLLRKEVV